MTLVFNETIQRGGEFAKRPPPIRIIYTSIQKEAAEELIKGALVFDIEAILTTRKSTSPVGLFRYLSGKLEEGSTRRGYSLKFPGDKDLIFDCLSDTVTGVDFWDKFRQAIDMFK